MTTVKVVSDCTTMETQMEPLFRQKQLNDLRTSGRQGIKKSQGHKRTIRAAIICEHTKKNINKGISLHGSASPGNPRCHYLSTMRFHFGDNQPSHVH